MIKRAFTIGIVLLAGCGAPQVGPENYRLIESLRTAVSTRNNDWLEENRQQVAKRHAAGEINDEQFTAFDTIIKQARGGDWAGAEDEVIKLARAQRAGAGPPQPKSAKQSDSAPQKP